MRNGYRRKRDIRRQSFDSVYAGLEFISNECHSRKHCKKCDLYVDNDCMLNKPPEHWQLGDILMQLFDPNKDSDSEKDVKFKIKE